MPIAVKMKKPRLNGREGVRRTLHLLKGDRNVGLI